MQASGGGAASGTIAKRSFDFVVAALILPIVVPLCLLCAIAIRLEGPGSPLFLQRRLGRDERPFTLFKLRTMRTDTGDRASHEVPRTAITRVGRFLRHTKLDELPQAWNVLLGEMSFVGHRPCLPNQTELVEARRTRGVFAIRPGVTGAAQVAGIDMSTPVALAEADAAYMRSRSFRGDLAILLATARGGRGDAVGRREGQ